MWATLAPGLLAARRTFSDAGRTLQSLEEAQSAAQADSASSADKKKTVRRLSDMLGSELNKEKQKKQGQPSIGSKRDVWLVSFTDVVIRCQRVGVTKLPMGSRSSLSTSSSKRASVTLSNRERNLYKFLKIDHWVMLDRTSSRQAGMVSMEAVARYRTSLSGRIAEELPLTESEADEEGDDEGGNEQSRNIGKLGEKTDVDAHGDQADKTSRMR